MQKVGLKIFMKSNYCWKNSIKKWCHIWVKQNILVTQIKINRESGGSGERHWI